MNYTSKMMGPEDQYLKEHPNATLEEYVKYKHDTDNENLQKKIERDENRKQWYKNLIGRYFYINHNSKSRCIFEVAKSEKAANGIRAALMYRFYREGRTVKLEIDVDQPLNEYWFNNPYEYYNRNANTCVKEIDEYTFREMTGKISEINDMHDYLMDEFVKEIEKN